MKCKGQPRTLNTSPLPPLPGCGSPPLGVSVLSREDCARPGVASPENRKTAAATASARARENENCCVLPASVPPQPSALWCPGCLHCLGARPRQGPPKRPLRIAAGGAFGQHVSEFTSQERSMCCWDPRHLLTDVPTTWAILVQSATAFSSS